jgi:hypothetical protein
MFFTNHMLKYKSQLDCVNVNYGCLCSLTASVKSDVELALSKASSQLSTGSIQSTSDGPEAFCIPIPTHGENERFAYASAALDLR